MKKEKGRNRTKKVRKVKKGKRTVDMNIKNKASHDREVSIQLQMCEEFVTRVNECLFKYGSAIDNEGTEALGGDSDEIIEILNTIDTDLKAFDTEYQKLATQSKEFIAWKGGEEYEWTATSIGLCTDMNSLRDQYVHLYMLNQQALTDLMTR